MHGHIYTGRRGGELKGGTRLAAAGVTRVKIPCQDTVPGYGARVSRCDRRIDLPVGAYNDVTRLMSSSPQTLLGRPSISY